MDNLGLSDAQVRLIVMRHLNEIFRIMVDPDRKDEKRRKTFELSSEFRRQVEEAASQMSPADADSFRNRVDAEYDKQMESWNECLQKPDEGASASASTIAERTIYVRQRSNYVGRTIVRAFVWNIVNSIFRVFR